MTQDDTAQGAPQPSVTTSLSAAVLGIAARLEDDTLDAPRAARALRDAVQADATEMAEKDAGILSLFEAMATAPGDPDALADPDPPTDRDDIEAALETVLERRSHLHALRLSGRPQDEAARTAYEADLARLRDALVAHTGETSGGADTAMDDNTPKDTTCS